MWGSFMLKRLFLDLKKKELTKSQNFMAILEWIYFILIPDAKILSGLENLSAKCKQVMGLWILL